MSPPLRLRQAARALILTDDAELVLLRFEWPDATVWALPGGGIEAGETPEVALRRELVEEVGWADAQVGPLIWRRRHVIPMFDGQWDGQEEQVHLIRVPERFDIRPALTPAQLLEENVHEVRWCGLGELAGLTAETTWFAPRRLPELLADLVAHGPPPNPMDVGI